MRRDEDLIEQINRLWLPVYPFMADHLLAASGVRSGRILDFGPFAGGIAVSLLEKNSEFHATILDESERVLRWAVDWACEKSCSSRLAVRRVSSIEAIDEPDESFDLVIMRGAFFYLTPFLLRECKRVLRPGGFLWVGGGYGPLTPDEVIAPIADRSRRLNEALGKQRLTADEGQELIDEAGLTAWAQLSTEGGLWIEIRNYSTSR